MKMEYRLEEIYDLQMGKTPSRNNLDYWNTTDNKWISIADLSKCGKYIENTKEYLSNQAVEESGISQIPANTVVMSFKLSIGKTAITSEPMYSNEAIMSFRDKMVTDILPDYIYYLFFNRDWSEGTNKAVMGKTLNKATLSKIKVNIPDMKSQQKVVEVLDKVNNIIDARKSELKELNKLIKARFVELFGDPELNPMGWERVTLNDVCSSIVRGPFGSALKKEFFVEPDETTYKVYEQKHAIQKSASIGTYYITEENAHVR
jgi:type I restriction enzyme, S subunit